MPICIECRYPVPQLYHVLHSTSSKTTISAKSDAVAATAAPPRNVNEGLRGGGEAAKKPRSAGTDVRLTQCPRCKRFADKYVEHDFVVLFIDLILVKPQVYRHLLINRLGSSSSSSSSDSKSPKFDPSIKRLAILLTLFDVYLTWSRIEALPATSIASSPIPQWPIYAQYCFFLVLSVSSTLAQHLVIRLVARVPFLRTSVQTAVPASVPGTPNLAATDAQTSEIPRAPMASTAGYAMPSAVSISTALIVSSCMKLFPILMVVWKYDDAGGQVARGVKWAVAVQNLEALRILMGLAYWQAAILVFLGRAAESLVENALLQWGGLGSVGIGWSSGLGIL